VAAARSDGVTHSGSASLQFVHGQAAPARPLRVDIVVPVYNEERDLRASVTRLVEFLDGVSFFAGRVIVADNGSTDRTFAIAQALAREHGAVEAVHVPRKGRGGALRAVWSRSDADVVSYMDVDLSTNLAFFPLLIHGLSIGYHVAVGSRLLQASQTHRRLGREVLSRGYNRIVKALFWNHFSDAQCGFKAVDRVLAQRLLPHVRDDSWFFDTELMLLAERSGLRVFEVPVEWVEDLDSRVPLVRTALEDLRGLLRVRFTGFPARL
jgi:glycosyltransferase involved in cell wall biosynthesis